MKRRSDLTAAVAWFFVLLLLIPGVTTHWTFLSFGATLKPAALSASAIAYAIFGLWVLMAFVWWCKRRRLAFGAFLLVLCALHIFLKTPTPHRILTFATYAVVIGILVEFVRQNMPLYRHLKASSARIYPMLRKTLLLWSPALLFISLGIYLNHRLVEWTTQALYETTLIDEYCSIRAKPTFSPIPCTCSPNQRGTEVFVPLEADDDIALHAAIHVDDLFLQRQEQAVAELSRLDAEDEEAPYEVLKTQLDPVAMLGLGEVANACPIEKQRKVLDGWREELEKLERRKPGSGEYMARSEIEERIAKHEIALENMKETVANLPLGELRTKLCRLSAVDLEAGLKNLMVDLTEVDGNRRSATLRNGLEEITSQLRIRTTEILLHATPQENESLIKILACAEPEKGQPELQPLSVTASVEHSLHRWLKERESELQAGLHELERETKTIEELPGVHENLWEEEAFLPASIKLGRSKCGLFHLGGCVLNYTKRKAEGSYNGAWEKLRDGAVNNVDKAAKQGEATTEALIEKSREELENRVEDAHKYLNASLNKVVKGGAIASALLKLFLALAIIKSLFYVLATEVFHQKGLSFIGLEGETTSEGAYQLSTSVEIPRDVTIPMITATVGVNQGQETIIPQPARGLASRILRSKWILNRGTHTGPAAMRFTQPGGRIGVDWEMQEGEEVVFNYRDLLGFSENVELRSTISLQLASLLLGKHIYHSARSVGGPGRLLLSVSGQVEDHQEDVQTFPLERLIAWNRHANFTVMDKRTLGAVFKDGFTVGRQGEGEPGSGLLVVGAPTARPPIVHGTIRFVKTFLMPF